MDAKERQAAEQLKAKRNMLRFLDNSENHDKVGAYNTAFGELNNALRLLPDCGTGLAVEWSGTNRAWTVRWHSQLLRLIPSNPEVRSYLRGLVEPAVAVAREA